MMLLKSDRRFIEDSFPVKEVGIASAKEKSIRHGHPSTLHIWWARRPLASSRITSYAALVPVPDSSEMETKRRFLIDFSSWKNTTNERMVAIARKEILKSNNGVPPKVLDPFGGGGSIPLEALRLGCETHSSDLNPVAVFIQKCTIEYPQMYGSIQERHATSDSLATSANPLLEDVQKWAQWVFEKSKNEISKFYPDDSETARPVGYIWARTIPCQNPSCNALVPLMRQFWLSRKTGRNISLFPVVENKRVTFKIVGNGYEKMPTGFNPQKGTVKGAVATCLVCGGMIDAGTVRKLFRDGHSSQQMVAVVVNEGSHKRKSYRLTTGNDLDVFSKAQEQLNESQKRLSLEWGMDALPNEPIHTPDGKEYYHGQPLYNFIPVLLYGMNRWADLFNDRQKLSLITFIQNTRLAYEEMLKKGSKSEYAKAVVSYLALMVDRLADKNASLVFYNAHRETIEHVFGRQAVSMVWDYVEANPLGDVGWRNMSDWVLRNIKQLALSSSLPAVVSQSNATSLEYNDETFDAVFTDPPYYDNIPYADLSDFFYVWLKRSVGHLYPELFSTPLTPKSAEIIAELPLLRGMNKSEAVDRIPGIKTKKDFERMLSQAFGEIHRVLKQGGIAVIVYAHKSTEGWETLINSLIDSGLVVTAAWPINTEKRGRLRAHGSAALASSIYIVARKTKQRSTGFYKDVKGDLRKHLNRRLEKLWSEGIGGADFFIAAIGSAIEIFGIYKEVIDYEGTPIRADRLLDDVREIATNYAIQQILHNGFSGEVSQLTRFYVLFRWNYKLVRIDFDEARKLAQSCGLELSEHWSGTGFIRKEKEFIKVLGPQERELKDLQGHTEMIDVLHHVLLLWEKGKRDKMSEILTESGFHRNEVFWRVAQAISETLSIQDKEKKLLDGFLAGRNGYFDREQYDQVTVQGLPVKTSRKKKRSGQSPQMDREDEHEQVKLE